MTTYGAYNDGLPCKNPNCKSHGKSHPNCRCYGENYAAGGEVEHYCAKEQPHRRGCKFFADGGIVNPLDVPQHIDSSYSVASYLAHGGLHGLLKEGLESPQDALDKYNGAIKKGHKLFESHVESLFGGDRPQARDHSKGKEAIDNWVSKGGINHDIQNELYKQNEAPAQFASGGKVEKPSDGILHKKHIAEAYPEHNVMLQAAKGRMSNYLSGLKPQPHQPKLAFDDAPDDRQQKKSYKEALHIAAHPLSILEEIHRGTIDPEQIGHFKALHPEVDEAVQKKLTSRIVEAQLSGKKPSRHIRQGLSLLLGTPLSGELSPQNIMAAQAVFQKQGPAPQQGQPPKKSSALSKTSQSYLLPNQAAAERQQKQ